MSERCTTHDLADCPICRERERLRLSAPWEAREGNRLSDEKMSDSPARIADLAMTWEVRGKEVWFRTTPSSEPVLAASCDFALCASGIASAMTLLSEFNTALERNRHHAALNTVLAKSAGVRPAALFLHLLNVIDGNDPGLPISQAGTAGEAAARETIEEDVERRFHRAIWDVRTHGVLYLIDQSKAAVAMRECLEGQRLRIVDAGTADLFDLRGDALRLAAEARDKAQAKVDVMSYALSLAADKFADYAKLHSAKNTAAGAEKARTNASWARYCMEVATTGEPSLLMDHGEIGLPGGKEEAQRGEGGAVRHCASHDEFPLAAASINPVDAAVDHLQGAGFMLDNGLVSMIRDYCEEPVTNAALPQPSPWRVPVFNLEGVVAGHIDLTAIGGKIMIETVKLVENRRRRSIGN